MPRKLPSSPQLAVFSISIYIYSRAAILRDREVKILYVIKSVDASAPEHSILKQLWEMGKWLTH